MEYEDAPSGYVTLYNYKEPLMKFTKGFGYQGVLLFDGKSDLIQCHFCGKWYEQLPHHLAREHNMFARDYKNYVGLMQTTALVSESLRAKMIANGLDQRLQNFRNKGRGKRSEATKKKISDGMIRTAQTAEFKNIKGVCPEQIIDRLLKLYKDNGNKTPSSRAITFYESMIKTYGSYKNACNVAGIPYNDPLEALRRGSYKKKNENELLILDFIQEFYLKNNRLPVYADYYKNNKDNLYSCLVKKGNREELEKKAVCNSGRYNRNLKGVYFTKDELLGLLRSFEKLNGRRPSYSDVKRGLLPYLSKYKDNFGSWKNVLRLAFVVKSSDEEVTTKEEKKEEHETNIERKSMASNVLVR